MKKNEQIIVRLEASLRDRLQQIADADNRSLSYVARLAMERGLPSLEAEHLPTKAATTAPAKRKAA